MHMQRAADLLQHNQLGFGAKPKTKPRRSTGGRGPKLDSSAETGRDPKPKRLGSSAETGGASTYRGGRAGQRRTFFERRVPAANMEGRRKIVVHVTPEERRKEGEEVRKRMMRKQLRKEKELRIEEGWDSEDI